MIDKKIDIVIENFKAEGIEVIEADIIRSSEENNRLLVHEIESMMTFLINNNKKEVFFTKDQFSEEHLILEELVTEEKYGKVARKILRKVKKYNENVENNFGKIYFGMFYFFEQNIMLCSRFIFENNEIFEDPLEALEQIEFEFSEKLWQMELEKNEIERKEKELQQQKQEEEIEQIIMEDKVFLKSPNKDTKVYRALQIANNNGISITKTDMSCLVDIIQTKIKINEEENLNKKENTEDKENNAAKEKEIEEKILKDEVFINVATKDAKIYRAMQIANENNLLISKTDMIAIVDIIQTKLKLEKNKI